jgi:hypothetical protein
MNNKIPFPKHHLHNKKFPADVIFQDIYKAQEQQSKQQENDGQDMRGDLWMEINGA